MESAGAESEGRVDPEGLDLPGPSRRIRVEPIRLPEPARRTEPAPEPIPGSEPAPERERVPDAPREPDREPA